MYVAQDDGTCIMTYDFWVAGSQTGAMQLIWRLPWPFGGKSMLQPSKLSNGRGHPAQLRLSKVWRMRKWMWTLIRPGGLTTLCLQFHDAVQLPPFWTRVELSLAVVFSFECKGWDLMGIYRPRLLLFQGMGHGRGSPGMCCAARTPWQALQKWHQVKELSCCVQSIWVVIGKGADR